MKVAMVRPPVVGHAVRGVGFYAQRLFTALEKLVEIKWIDFSFLPHLGFDIIHYPYFDFSWPTLPPVRGAKTVVTVHDLIPLKFPDKFPFGFRASLAWPWQKLMLTGVDAILTDSQCSKKDIAEITGINKTYVIYLAADKVFRPLKLKRENFVLYVGGTNWNKNVLTLVKACQVAKTPLVIVGKEFALPIKGHAETQPLREILDAARMTDNVKFLGFVETDELVRLYNQAKVYVQPSIYEGFGLPVLEAMACGTPVICGRNSSLVEIAADAATYSDVTDASDLADKIKSIKPTGRELIQAEKFSWEKTAQETHEVYQSILGRN